MSATALATVTADVRAACRVRLTTLAGAPLPALAAWEYEGLAFTPVAGTAWLRETLAPVVTDARTIGPHRRVECVYTYAVRCFQPSATPATTGGAVPSPTATLDAQADAVVALFEPGVAFTAPSGRVVHVRDVRRAPLVPAPDWTQAPVLVTCTTDATTAS